MLARYELYFAMDQLNKVSSGIRTTTDKTILGSAFNALTLSIECKSS